tara:strand:- start:407 stop:1408 length:1002 start_codon:yes stop_codon:yes gene_type:complete
MLFTPKIDPNAGYRKERYYIHSEKVLEIPIFSKGWWLDATAGRANWDVAIVERDGKIVASIPYMFKKQFGFIRLTQPPLTMKLGPWIRKSDAKNTKKLRREKDLMNELINQLPAYSDFRQNWNHEITNWLPFYWRGFEQTTRYTYRLPNLIDEKKIWGQLAENIRREIRKAKNRFSLKVRDDLNVQDFLELSEKTFNSKGINQPFSKDLVQRIDDTCGERNVKKILIAEDSKGQRHAGIYIVWDENSVYYLMGGGDPLLRRSGATSLCMWEAILFAASLKKSFDFEGSMLEPVERFFRGFGAFQTPYFSVSRTPSRFIKVYFFVKDMILNNHL